MLGPVDIQKQNLETPPAAPVEAPTGSIVSPVNEGEEYVKRKIVEILGDELNSKDDYKVQALYEYAQLKGAKNIEDILWEIRYLGNRLGTPGYGESRLSYLYEYVYLLSEERQIKDKLKKMEVFNE